MYKIAITAEDGTEIPVPVKPLSLGFGLEEEVLYAEVSWCEEALKDYPEAYAALLKAWPGQESLVAWRDEEEEPVFTGLLSKVADGKDVLCLKASGDGGPGPQPLELTASEDAADPNRMTALIVANNGDQGAVTLDFGDGSPTESNPGDGSTETPHAYAEAGTYTVTGTDEDDPSITATVEVTVPFGDTPSELEVTVTEDTADPNRLSVLITANNGDQGSVLLDFGDQSETESNPGDGTTQTPHAYAQAGTFTVTATDEDDPSRTGTAEVTVPFV
jgi:hypothetical protein